MDLDALRAAVSRGEPGAWLARVRPAVTGRRSAVAAVVSADGVVLVRKSGRLRRHAGQVAFPGGAVHPGEPDVDAALREAQEETGLCPAEVDVWGSLATTHIPVSGYDVVCVVAGWAAPRELVPEDPGEVVDVRRIRWADLAAPANRFVAVHPASGFESRGFDVDGWFVWGYTGFVLDELVRAGGAELPWDRARRVDVPSGLRG